MFMYILFIIFAYNSAANIPKARVKSWKSIEMNGWVYVWYHDNDQEPIWQLKRFEELKENQMCGEYKTHFNGHIVVNIVINILIFIQMF